MPTYNFRNKETEEITERFFKVSEMEQFLKDNPNQEITHQSPPAIGDPVRLGVRKADGEFRSLLKHIKSQHIRSNINY